MTLRRRLAVSLMLTLTAALSLPATGLAFVTGVGDQHWSMFSNPLWTQLNTPIARYIAPYDTITQRDEYLNAQAWISQATSAHQRILIAFSHSEHTPTRMPSVATYTVDVENFVKLFPQITDYQAWNEENRGNVNQGQAHFASPNPTQAAAYYKALESVCTGCNVTGLDILDQNDVRPTLKYISQFKAALRRQGTPVPTLWGLHNYSDTNRFGSSRTHAILKAVPGQIWLTETGGILSFGGAFTNRRGSGDTRAAKALSYMFRLAHSNGRITRLYIFSWSGDPASRFDAGLIDKHGVPRPGYQVVCKQLHAARCGGRGFKVDRQH